MKDVSYEKLVMMIKESTTDQLVPAFAFLGVWLATCNSKETDQMTTIQSAYHLIDIFITHVPPVILLAGISELNLGINQPNLTFVELFQRLFSRILKLNTIVSPYYVNIKVLRWPQLNIVEDSMQLIRVPGLIMEIESDSVFQEAYARHLRMAILNHFPVTCLESFLKHHNSRIILTDTIIDILRDLNLERKATHPQLLFMFSSVFQYIQTFAVSGDIDGQILCEYLQSAPFLSPFCLLAFVNYIPQSLYLYNLFIPAQLAGQQVDYNDALNIINEQYPMVDMSLDNSFNSLIDLMPNILLSYFLPGLTYKRDLPPPINIPNQIAYIQLYSSNMCEKMKEVIRFVRGGQADMQDSKFDSIQISAMGIQLLKLIIVSILKSITECVKSGMFKPSMRKFFYSAMQSILPTTGITIFPRYLKSPVEDYAVAELYLKMIAFGAIHMVVNAPNQHDSLPFIYECLNHESTVNHYARYILMKTARVRVPALDAKESDYISNTSDIIIALDIITMIEEYHDPNTYEDIVNFGNAREHIIKKLPLIVPNIEAKPFMFLGVKTSQINGMNSVSTSVLQSVNQILTNKPLNLFAAIKSMPFPFYIVRVLASHQVMKQQEYAQTITTLLIEFLNEEKDFCHPDDTQFPISVRMYSLPIAQFVVTRLLLFGFQNEALLLFRNMKIALIQDKVTLHWLDVFMCKHFNLLTPQIKDIIHDIIINLPCAKEFYFTDPDYILKYSNLLNDAVENCYCQNPDVMQNEYNSRVWHISAFAAIAIMLRREERSVVIRNLLLPVFDLSRPWFNRESQCYSLARIVSMLPSEFGYDFVIGLLSKPTCEIALNTARLFLVYSKLDVYERICNDSLEIIHGNEITLQSYMIVILPSFERLKSDDNVATKLLCGLLESVSPSIPRSLQENVIDAVSLVYVTLKLERSRTSLINSSKAFPPELRAIIASSLDLDLASRTST